MKTLTLKRNAHKRFASGHPWVFSNEIQSSPKDYEIGDVVRLVDHENQEVAFGYVNPNSLIFFRELSRKKDMCNLLSQEFFEQRIQTALRQRQQLGLNEASFRLVFGEADALSGLIIDRFSNNSHQVFVIQPHTAAMDQHTLNATQALLTITNNNRSALQNIDIHHTYVLISRSSSFRKHEGLEIIESPEIAFEPPNKTSLEEFQIKLRSLDKQSLYINFISSQKTGFFLDQQQNILLTRSFLNNKETSPDKPIRILDLFSYIGQWGISLGHHLNTLNTSCEIDFADASKDALTQCELNSERLGIPARTIKRDIIDNPNFDLTAYDIVICDPPALIKNKKHYYQGLHGYLKANIGAMNSVKSGGLLVSCSCSGLLDDTSFFEMLGKAEQKTNSAFLWIAKGLQSPDHPVLSRFPEGSYLKCWIGQKL